MIGKQISFILKVLKYLSITLAVILLISVIRQIVWIFDILHYFNPVIGYLFIALIALGLIYVGIRLGKNILSLPKKLIPPDQSRKNYFIRKHKYLIKYCRRLLENKYLDLSYSKERMEVLDSLIQPQSTDTSVSELNQKIIIEVIIPTHLILSKEAEENIRSAVRDTMLGVMLSPFRALDSILVISKSFGLFFKLITIFNQRPSISEIIAYFKDAMHIVVNVNLLSYSDQATKYIFAKVPFMDRTADEMIQGIGAGILVTSFGRATLQRVQCYEVWVDGEEKEKFARTLQSFAVYIRDIISNDLVTSLSSKMKEAWDRIKSRFSKVP